jgi:hypothetical protein
MENKIKPIIVNNFIDKVTQVATAFTVLSYIIFSIIKRFTVNPDFFWIPIFLFSANFLIILELVYKVRFKKAECSLKSQRSLIFQCILNICFIIYVMTYLK